MAYTKGTGPVDIGSWTAPMKAKRGYAGGGTVGATVGSAIGEAMREESKEELAFELEGVKNPQERQAITEEHQEGESAVQGIVQQQAQKALHK